MHITRICAVVLTCLLVLSCAAIFKGSSSKVDFASTPAGARVLVNGNDMGVTPVRLKLASKENYSIEFRLEGYKPKVVNIQNHVGAGWIVLDVLAGLVPVIIDAATGSWYELDQKNVNAVLEKQQPHPSPLPAY